MDIHTVYTHIYTITTADPMLFPPQHQDLPKTGSQGNQKDIKKKSWGHIVLHLQKKKKDNNQTVLI